MSTLGQNVALVCNGLLSMPFQLDFFQNFLFGLHHRF